MSRPARLDIRRMRLHVHVDRSSEAQLTILQNNRVPVLRDAVDRPIKGPIENDAGGLATKPRIVFSRELGSGLFAEFRQFGTAIKTRPRLTRTAAAATASRTALRPGLIHGAERHQTTANTARICHDKLLGRPVSWNIRFAGRAARRPLRVVRRLQRTTDLLNLALWSLHVLSVPVHAASVLKDDRLEVTRVRIDEIGRSLYFDLLTERKELLAPSRSPQDMHRTHFAPVTHDLAVCIRTFEVKPRMRINQIHSR